MVPDEGTADALKAIDIALRRNGHFLMKAPMELEASHDGMVKMGQKLSALPEEVNSKSANCELVKVANGGYFGYAKEGTGELADMGREQPSLKKSGATDGCEHLMWI
eukprot:141315_1